MSLLLILVFVLLITLVTVLTDRVKSKTPLELAAISLSFMIFGALVILTEYLLQTNLLVILSIGYGFIMYGVSISIYALFKKK